MIVPDKNRDPCSVHCWRTTALRRRIAPFSHDILLSSSHRPCQRESERFSIPPGVKSAHIWRLSSATRSTYIMEEGFSAHQAFNSSAANAVIAITNFRTLQGVPDPPRIDVQRIAYLE